MKYHTRQFEKRIMNLADQFDDGGQVWRVRVEKVERLGNPVDKNDESIADPDSDLLCYKVQRA